MQLASEYRPKSFAEVVGQEVVSSVLSRQIALKTFKSSYLFCGPSGCGKTTVARIFSNDINNGNGSPREIDAATHNGIDDIRNIYRDAQQASLDCDYKVYIIDECHQLTRAAWDAMLKLIEEPPLGTVFIFCTTDPSKIPETIMSRVQRFDFVRVSLEDIENRLEFICNEELKVQYDKNALRRIASLANGNVREAIKSLDTLISTTNNIKIEDVNKLYNSASIKDVVDFCKYLFNKDDTACTYFNKFMTTTQNYVNLYDDILSIAIDFEIYLKTFNKHIVSIPEEFLNINRYAEAHPIVERLSKYRPYINDANAMIFLKIVISEVLYGTK